MRSACSAFSTDIAIQRAGSAREGRHTRVGLPERVLSASVRAATSSSSMFSRISAGGGDSA